MQTPNLKTIKRLFAVSQNRCAFPGCVVPIVESTGTVTGEIAHIKAANPQGPRPDEAQLPEERHEYDNLILLCGRHHFIVDSEVSSYSVETLRQMKQAAELRGTVEISPTMSIAAQALLTKYGGLAVQNKSGQIAIDSPGAIQAQTINFQTKKSKVVVGPSSGSLAANQAMRSYIEYLIDRYQDYQKQDVEKIGEYKYMAIYNAIKRRFKSKWQNLPESVFAELIGFLQERIDGSKVGRIRKKRGQARYHDFASHGH